MHPAYLTAYNNGTLEQRIEQAFGLLASCSICPRQCKVDRLKDELGFCRTGLKPKVCSFMPHHGEEPPLSGEHGSGTIFFSACNMGCVYCQNYEFSQLDKGKEVEFDELAGFMLQLQDMGCHNINFVTPTHVMPQILKALSIAVSRGLNIPLVYNTGGYELADIIRLLDGIVEIYLPDMRYADDGTATEYSCAPEYPRYNQEALREMYRQASSFDIDSNGVIKKGIIIRHLVLPEGISGTDKIMKFISQELSTDAHISLMSQYLPCYRASQFRKISRRISYAEYNDAQELMQRHGLYNGWMQDSYGLERYAGTNIKPSINI